MTRYDFKFAHNFPEATDAQVSAAAEYVEIMFSGVLRCWARFPEPIRTEKRTLLENLLVAWYLLDMDPAAAVGVVGNGGMALSSKSIGGTSVSFSSINVQEGLEQLNSNVFGQKALVMIQGIPERYTIYA